MNIYGYRARQPAHKGTRWNIRHPDEEIVAHIRKTTGASEIVARVLVNRGYFDADSVERFMRARLQMLYDPLRLGGVKAAVYRIYKAIDAGERITVYGDYDVDGVTSTALLVRVLRALGADVDYFIPSRYDHGYGLHIPTLKNLAAAGTKVIITVDCGIGAVEPVRCAQESGIDVIITDHHEPRVEESDIDDFDLTVENPLFDYAVENHEADKKLSNFAHVIPPACAVINPKLGHYPFSELAGVGVAFKLAHGIVKIGRSEGRSCAEKIDLHRHLDLVALGTLADAVPLRDENRIFVMHGLPVMEQSDKPGIRALCDVSDVKNCSVETVIFRLAPRINAAGRMTHAESALKLMLTEDAAEAVTLARELDHLNKARQKVERETFRAAMEEFEKTIPVELPKNGKLSGGLRGYFEDSPGVIVLSSSEWNPGVVGIVASRMVERYYLPAVIIAVDGEKGHGSCRSIREFHIFDALRQCRQLLERFGGHRVAAGLTICEKNVSELRRRLNTIAMEELEEEERTPALHIDAEITLEECNLSCVEQLDLCKPYGQKNPRPMFAVRRVKIVEDPRIFKDKHAKICVLQGKTYQHIIGFNWAQRVEELLMWAQMDVVVCPYLDTYRGEPRIEMQLIDAQESQ